MGHDTRDPPPPRSISRPSLTPGGMGFDRRAFIIRTAPRKRMRKRVTGNDFQVPIEQRPRLANIGKGVIL